MSGAAPASSVASRLAAQDVASTSFVAVLAFMSGCAALVFQVAWMRELRLVFGATTASVAAVLAIFMAGIGIGSAVLGKRADRAANPLRMYGALEIAIALCVAISPWLIDLARNFYFSLGGQESLGLSMATVVRLALAAAVMAVPTFLMGGTLPAAVRSVTLPTDEHRRALGILYGSNTLGAVFGAAVTTFFTLEALGTRATLWGGCALGLCAGSLAIVRAKQHDPRQNSTAKVATDPTSDDAGELGFRAYLIYLAAAILGFTFFALELVWYRMLGPILGGTAFTFGLILCVALFGIGVGGVAYNFVFRRLQPSWAALAITCGLEALLTIVPYALGDRVALIAGWNAEQADSFLAVVYGWTYVTSIVVLPVAFISGLQFPLLIALLGEGRPGISRQLGMVYAWNTLGAIAGSLVGGFGGIPLLTAPGMWLAVASLMAIFSVALLACAPRIDRRAVAVVMALAVVTFGSMFSRGPTSSWRHSGIGAGRSNLPPKAQANHLQQWLNFTRQVIVWDADGSECSVGIHGADGYGFIVNGKSDGNAFNDAGTQIGLSILGAVLHENPKRALVIGLGTGESAGWLAQFRNIEHVDVVELEPKIDEMASRCADVNWDVLNHPRVTRIYNDGREFVSTTNNKYDLIISEPSNPYRAGIATLYTAEFYRAVKKRLNPGGLFVQWLQAYEISDDTVGTVVTTAGTQFAHVELWQTLPNDLQLICSETPLKYTAAELRERISSKYVAEAIFKSWAVTDLEGFLARFFAAPGWVKEMTESGVFVQNTDDRTVLEYGFAKSLGATAFFEVEGTRKRMIERGYQHPSMVGDVDWNRVEVRRQVFNAVYGGKVSLDLLPKQEDQEFVKAVAYCVAGKYEAALQSWPANYLQPENDIDRMLLARCYAALGRPEFLEIIDKVADQHPTEAASFRTRYYVGKKEWGNALTALNDMLDHLEKNPWYVPDTVDDGFQFAAEITAHSDNATREEICKRLGRPLASRRRDYQRWFVRLYVASQIGPERVAEVVSEVEPNPLWLAGPLHMRAKAYAEVHHPLAKQAQRDWEWFQRNEPAGNRRRD